MADEEEARAAASEVRILRIVRAGDMEEAARCCWVCYGGEEGAEPTGMPELPALTEWVQPCRCSGSGKWVHQACLQKWVDVMQKGNINKRISCPQCKTEYILIFQPMGMMVTVLDAVEEVTHKLCPFITGGVLLGSIYWSAITYGAVTVMQVLGHKDGLELLEAADPILLLLFLPAVPAVLICERAIHWEETLLRMLHASCQRFNTTNPNRIEDGQDANAQADVPFATGVSLVVGGNNSPTRVLCSALVLPTVSTFLGRILFGSVRSYFHRAAFGGLTILLLRGVVTIYHKRKLLIRQSSRKILDYTANNLRLHTDRAVCDDCATNNPSQVPVASHLRRAQRDAV